MTEDIYLKLGERLNRNFMRLPLGEPVLDFLRKAFTPEQAQVAANLPMGAHPLDHLAGVLNRESEALFTIFDRMADKGIIFIHKDDHGVNHYSLPPFFPGIVEFQTMRGSETAEDVEMAQTIKRMLDYLDDVGRDLFKNPEVANKILPAGLRTLTVEKALPVDGTIMPFEQVSAIIEQETLKRKTVPGGA